jgi:LL-diaminopimelate aminotransferase
MFFSYPNNPTGAVATSEDMKTIADFCDDNNIIACHDNAYSEITFDGFKAPSFLQCSMNGVEFHSLSKTFNMTGFRIGFCVGNEEVIKALKMVKSQIDSGPSIFVQRAAAKALASYSSSERPECVMRTVREYEKRRNLLHDGLLSKGIECTLPKGTFYLWVKGELAEKLLEKDIVVTPGESFGSCGKVYVRFALTQPLDRIEEALRRLGS